MYRVMLVDDDLQVQKGLSKYVKWKEHGFEVEYWASSATDALENLEKKQYDLVITDIRMPGRSGIELLEEIRTKDKELCVGILSAYGEFDYARSAIKSGALSYLMKPVDFDEIHQFLKKARNILDTRKKSVRRYDNFLEEKTILAMIKNQGDENKQSISNTYPWLYEQNQKILIRLQFINETTKEDKSNLLEEWDMLLAEERFITVGKSDNEYLTVLQVENLSIIDSIKEYKLEKQWALGVSSMIETDYSLGQLYEEASRAVYYHGIYPMQVVFYENTEKNLLQGNDLEENFKEGLMRDLSIDDYGGFIQRLSKEYNNNIENGYTIDLMLQFLIQVSFLIQCYFIEHQQYTKIQRAIHKMTKNIVLCNCSKRILSESIEAIKEIFTLCESTKNSQGIIHKAQVYINEHYAQEITLDIVADHIYIHPIYLSRLFKEKTGDKFSNYVTRIRLNKAKELLKDKDLKTYQVSEMVGYESPKYFSRIFKSNVGCSPREFRRSLGT